MALFFFFHIYVLTPTTLSNEALDYMLAKGTDFDCIHYTWNRKYPRPLNLNTSSSVVLFSFTVFKSFQYVQKFLKFSERLKVLILIFGIMLADSLALKEELMESCNANLELLAISNNCRYWLQLQLLASSKEGGEGHTGR